MIVIFFNSIELGLNIGVLIVREELHVYLRDEVAKLSLIYSADCIQLEILRKSGHLNGFFSYEINLYLLINLRFIFKLQT